MCIVIVNNYLQCSPYGFLKDVDIVNDSDDVKMSDFAPLSFMQCIITGAYEPPEGRKERPTAWNGI